MASGPSCPDIASLSMFALPLVLSFSSLVIRNEGHITPPTNLRQAPLLLHISTAPWSPPAAPGHPFQSNVVGKSDALYPGA